VPNDVLNKYPKSLGMTVSGEKSQAFQVVAKKDTWFIKDPEVRWIMQKNIRNRPRRGLQVLGYWGHGRTSIVT
jgi:hypothetical protein